MKTRSLAFWVNSITSVWTRFGSGSGSVSALQGPTSLTLGDLTSQALCFRSWGAYPWYISLWQKPSAVNECWNQIVFVITASGASSVKPASSFHSEPCSSLDYLRVNKESVSISTTLLLCKWTIAQNISPREVWVESVKFNMIGIYWDTAPVWTDFIHLYKNKKLLIKRRKINIQTFFYLTNEIYLI